MTDQIRLLCDIKRLLEELVDRNYTRTNFDVLYEFDTSTTGRKSVPISNILGLPNKYKAVNLTILDVGGGFSFKIGGNDPKIEAIKNLTIDQEAIERMEFITSGSTGTAIIRFSTYIFKG